MGLPAVQFENVSKRFRSGQLHDSLRDLLPSLASRIAGRRRSRRRREEFWALEEVSFQVAQGESLGIIGPNGAGKSTALKLLSGILRPDRGSVAVNGRLAALIEIGAGFHQDLTGLENVYLNGAILGMNRREIRAKLDDIVSFAGLERFMDMPVKRYSSGMYARLGFSIAAHVDPEVLLVDEVLSVGDAVFRVQCIERMQNLIHNGTSLVFVTHNLHEMQSICDRAMVLEKGRNVFAGPSRDAVCHYLSVASRSRPARPPDVEAEGGGASEACRVLNLRILDGNGDEVLWIRPTQEVRAELTLQVTRHIPRLAVELNLRQSICSNLLSVNSTRGEGTTFDVRPGVHRITLTMPRIPISAGQYLWNVRIWDTAGSVTLVDTPFRYPMAIDDEGRLTGLLCIEHSWSIENTDAASEPTAQEPEAVASAP